jgi:hypothetical protein
MVHGAFNRFRDAFHALCVVPRVEECRNAELDTNRCNRLLPTQLGIFFSIAQTPALTSRGTLGVQAKALMESSARCFRLATKLVRG